MARSPIAHGKPDSTIDGSPHGMIDEEHFRRKNQFAEDEASAAQLHTPPSPASPPTGISSLHPHSLDRGMPSPIAQGTRHPSMAPSSPSRPLSTSPRIHSPASSQIFERSVQEDIGPSQTSPAIPSHIITENYIPPILDASSAALTDERLDPDSVEIVTHTCHQPALTVTGGQPDQPLSASFHDDTIHQRIIDAEDSVSNYGAPQDPADVRRLSFVSFADVVLGELAETDQLTAQDSYIGGQGTLSTRTRSPSPFRSPVALSHNHGTTSPTGIRMSDISPHRGSACPGSPTLGSHSPSTGTFGPGDLSIQTMRQALHRSESGDLGAFRS